MDFLSKITVYQPILKSYFGASALQNHVSILDHLTMSKDILTTEVLYKIIFLDATETSKRHSTK